ncbi:hypothetical protein RF11_05852 [Thelohanellus kitauei]|uniref:Uncharacterized protein n=1 Tax=Thelohanellus kitauei TaxID=669202 RepID=A0A0C2IW98_THEKT|nr:hypothetical protein RF11_05852 [Thelohanellus kitauei]
MFPNPHDISFAVSRSLLTVNVEDVAQSSQKIFIELIHGNAAKNDLNTLYVRCDFALPGSKLLDITPFYEYSLRLPVYLIILKSEHKISQPQIYLYSRSDNLSKIEQILEAIPYISNIHIKKHIYENGNLFIFHIYDSSNFLKVLYLNESSINPLTAGDKNETKQDDNGGVSTEKMSPTDFKAYKQISDLGIKCI